MSKFLRIWLETGAYIDSDAEVAPEYDGIDLDVAIGDTAKALMSADAETAEILTRKGVTEYVRADAIIRISVLEDAEPEPAAVERPVLIDRDGDTWVPAEDGLYAFREAAGPTADRRTRERIEEMYGPVTEQGAESDRPGALLLDEAFDNGAAVALRRVRELGHEFAARNVAFAMNVKIDD